MRLTPKIPLDDLEREWISKKWVQIRLAQQETDRANNEWNAINEALKFKFAREGITDIVQLADLISASIPLQDALATASWHARNAERHMDDVQLFLRLRELEIL